MAGNLLAAAAVHVAPVAALPFVLLLAAIAILPLVAGHWWHRHPAATALGEHRNKALVALLLSLPTAFYLSLQPHGVGALLHELQDYVSFILMLTALYVIAGGLVIRGALSASPLVNSSILLTGAILANFIGTTGASMLLIRPMLRINARRRRRGHVPLFFIFIVSNAGGLLTPLGDPPLFLGFLGGVDFFWTLSLWPQWLMMNGILLLLFAIIDKRFARDERPESLRVKAPEKLRIEGWKLNGPLLVLVAIGVLGKKYTPFPVVECWLVVCILVSMRFTSKPLREANDFAWGPMAEVAVLFAGIFVTMTPALALLKQHGGSLGVTEPWQFFWVTGLLSSCLDNAPTYLTMATLAAPPEGFAALAAARPDLLAAVSCGAVFMGANSYIGNGPNFMVKAIAEGNAYRMPSLFGYVAWAAVILGPIYLVMTWVFFR